MKDNVGTNDVKVLGNTVNVSNAVLSTEKNKVATKSLKEKKSIIKRIADFSKNKVSEIKNKFKEYKEIYNKEYDRIYNELKNSNEKDNIKVKNHKTKKINKKQKITKKKGK